MRSSRTSIVLALLSFCLHHVSASDPDSESIFREAQAKYTSAMQNELKQRSQDDPCNADTVVVRQSWDVLTEDQRADYIAAVQCLYELPSQLNPKLAPGARNKADDFVYSHINQTRFVHVSGIFVQWHRQYIWAYEQTLRDQCNYTGYLPYWDYLKHTDDQASSPVFDGGPNGFGGDGLYEPHYSTNDSLPDVPGPIYIVRSPGSGGGCVQDGAFANITLNLGPVCPADTPVDDPYQINGNPHCLKRDFLQFTSSNNLTYEKAARVVQAPSMATFSTALQPLHAGAHEFLGGDGYDLYSPPNDPVFFLLHAQVDRLWAIWQGQDYTSYKEQVSGTVTFANSPPSENATLDTILVMGDAAGGGVRLGDTVSTIENSFCYIYV